MSTYINTVMKETPFLESFINEGLINSSALAKKIHSILTLKGVKCTESSILMAIRRSHTPFVHKRKNHIFYLSEIGEISVNSNLIFYRFEKGNVIQTLRKRLVEAAKEERFSYMLFETVLTATVVLKMNAEMQNKELLNGIPILEFQDNLSAVNIEFSNEEIRMPGLYYMIFKQLAWHNINVYEVTSSGRELSLLIDHDRVKDVFEIIHTPRIGLFSSTAF